MRRRGYPAEAILACIKSIGMAKKPGMVEVELLEHFVREHLNLRVMRRMAVLRPLKVVVDNYPEDKVEWLEAENNPEDPTAGKRTVPFSRVLYIERDDFVEDPPKKYHRLSPGKEIRLKHAYYVTCVRVVKTPTGEVTEVHVTYDPDSRGGWTNDGRVVRGTSHWVSAQHAIQAEVRLLDRLFTVENPDGTPEGKDFTEYLNPSSEERVQAYLEPSLTDAEPAQRFQFLRQGYFAVDPDSKPGHLVLNRTVGLVDSWAKIQARERGEGGRKPRVRAESAKEETA